MQVRFWGVRGSIPVPGPQTARYGGNTPCLEVRAEPGLVIILDAGTGIRPLGLALAERPEQVRLALLISHVHWDHIQGLPFFAPIYRPETRLDIYGRVQDGTPLAQALAAQMSQPFFPVSFGDLPADITCHDLEGDSLDLGPVKVAAASVVHTEPSLAFRLEHQGRALVYTGDREGKPLSGPADQALRQICQGADLLVTDAMYSEAEYRQHQGWGHSTFDQALDLARAARAGKVVLFHHDPARSDAELDQLARHLAAQARPGDPEVFLAREGLELEV